MGFERSCTSSTDKMHHRTGADAGTGDLLLKNITGIH